MKILITSDFYADFELIKATEQNAIQYIKSEGANAENVTILGSSENLILEDAKADADKILFISDYM